VDVVAGIVGLLLGAFAIGAFARFALPGPDPLPAWLTIAIGASGSFVGGVALALVGGVPEDASGSELTGANFAASLAGATVVLFLFRRFVQKRPLTGPGAARMPLRPRGLRRILTRQPHPYLEETAAAAGDPLEGLEKLVALRDAGLIDAAEFERRKAAFVAKL
jgi:uncharacterized membrane protein YeaQ/YmgE (transglycosylase-associated protein family)